MHTSDHVMVLSPTFSYVKEHLQWKQIQQTYFSYS